LRTENGKTEAEMSFEETMMALSNKGVTLEDKEANGLISLKYCVTL
jgi:hypothetical protein